MITLNIKSIRIMRGMSTVDLSKMSGVSTGYISKMENGLAMPTVPILCKLANALKVCPGLLFSCSGQDYVKKDCTKEGIGLSIKKERGRRD